MQWWQFYWFYQFTYRPLFDGITAIPSIVRLSKSKTCQPRPSPALSHSSLTQLTQPQVTTQADRRYCVILIVHSAPVTFHCIWIRSILLFFRYQIYIVIDRETAIPTGMGITSTCNILIVPTRPFWFSSTFLTNYSEVRAKTWWIP